MKAVARLLTTVLAIAACACTQQELCYDHNHNTELFIQFDWSLAGNADPESMVLYFYPLDRPDQPLRYEASSLALAERRGVSVKLPQGSYQLICYNGDTESVNARNQHSFADHSLTTRLSWLFEPTFGNPELSGNSPDASTDHQHVVATPDMMWGVSVAEITVDENGVQRLVQTGNIASTSSDGRQLTLKPYELVSSYSFRIRNVENIESAQLFSGAMTGLSPEITLTSFRMHTALVAVPFEVHSDGVGTIAGTFHTFGFDPHNSGSHKLVIYVWLADGRRIYTSFDVSVQVRSARNPRQIDIDLDGMTLPEPTPGGSQGGPGFKPSVDDWTTEDSDLIM